MSYVKCLHCGMREEDHTHPFEAPEWQPPVRRKIIRRGVVRGVTLRPDLRIEEEATDDDA